MPGVKGISPERMEEVRGGMIESEIAKAREHKNKMIRDLVLNDGRIDIFAEYVLGFEPQQFHKEMLEWQSAHQEGLILAWRGAAKTTFLTIARCIFEILHNPNIRILLAADAQDQAKTFLRSIKSHFERNEKLREVFGDYVTGAHVWTETEITVNKRTTHAGEATIMCAGIGTTLPSRHFDIVIADDLVTQDNSQTEGQRKKVHEFFYKTLLPTLMSPHGRMWVIGTRWHSEDLYGWLEKEDYKDATYIMGVLDEDDKSMWEEQFPTERMLRIRRGNLDAFGLQYQCRGDQASGGIFNVDHFEYYEQLPQSYFMWQGVDLAVGQKSHNDYFAHVTIAVEKVTKVVYLVSVRKLRIPFPQQPLFIKKRWEEFPESVRVVVETNAYQVALKQTMRDQYPDIPVVGRYTLKDKITRAQQIATILTDKPLRIRRQHHEFLRHMVAFPNLKGSKDVFDAFDLALSQGLHGARKKRDNEPGLL